jgi:hypothetical protein
MNARHWIGTLAALAPCVPFGGCSVIGVTTGLILDVTGEDFETRDGLAVLALKESTSVEVRTIDDRVLRGKTAGLRDHQGGDWVAQWEMRRNRMPDLPPRGGSVVLRRADGSKAGAERFVGIGSDALYVASGRDVRAVPWHDISWIRSWSPYSLRGEELQAGVEDGSLPVIVSVVVQGDEGERALPLSELAEVTVPARVRWRQMGLVGLGIDIWLAWFVVLPGLAEIE